MKSVKPKDGSGEPPAPGGGRNADADFHGQKRSNYIHASTTDPDARLYRRGRGKETKLRFIGHELMENRHGLLIDARLTQDDGHAERVAALHMIEPRGLLFINLVSATWRFRPMPIVEAPDGWYSLFSGVP
ncbi:hypothetical protein FBZ96_11244 [Bradyrhizobium stylosanthis]|uniref:Uncharacterized protein n=1 Tax=Bradyrhizobium stylosanthis TaxID=1803665 RepID=A0A560D4K5_9BRAD|nr:hypothetical protein FBZ96_11244 [Bradyrhizobium stylosanthis]